MSATATVEFFKLQSDVSLAESMAWRARRAAQHYGAYRDIVGYSALARWHLNQAQGRIDKIRTMAGRLEIENDSHREDVREIAVKMAGLASVFADMHSEWTGVIAPRLCQTFPSLRFVGPWIESPLEDLACVTEDIAETLALSSSKPFVELVKEELNVFDIGA